MNSEKVVLLNHGHIRLVDSMGSDLSIVRNARVSYDAEWRTGEDEGKDAKLIDYLCRNKHTTPFEAVTFTFDVKAPIFVFRQWHRHRTISVSEVSARYSELPEEFYVPELSQITTQSSSNKQMRTTELNPKAAEIQTIIRAQCLSAFDAYHALIEMGTPRELARGVLPVNTYSHMFVTTNLLNLMKFCQLRLHPHAQYEIRVYAEELVKMAKTVCPVAVASFEKHWLNEA